MSTTTKTNITDNAFVAAQYGHFVIACVRLGQDDLAYEYAVHAFRAATRALAPYSGG